VKQHGRAGGVACQTSRAYFPSNAGLISASPNKKPIQAEGTGKHRTSLQHPTPGSAMLLNVLDGTADERRYTGGLSRSEASPYQRIENEDDDEDEYEMHYDDTSPEAKLIESANMIVLNKNDNSAWTSDRRRIRFDVIATSDT
jgi:hypothetical protein